MQKNALQFLKKIACDELKAFLSSVYLMRSEFETIIPTL